MAQEAGAVRAATGQGAGDTTEGVGQGAGNTTEGAACNHQLFPTLPSCLQTSPCPQSQVCLSNRPVPLLAGALCLSPSPPGNRDILGIPHSNTSRFIQLYRSGVCTVLYCTVHFTGLYCTLYCTILYTVLYCTLYCTVLYTVLYCTVLYTLLHCTLHCTLLYCTKLVKTTHAVCPVEKSAVEVKREMVRRGGDWRLLAGWSREATLL